MTIKELKAFIKDMPNDAEAVFALWQSDDKYTYFNIKQGNYTTAVRPIVTGGYIAIIGHADNCRADRMIEKKDGKFEY